MNINRSNYEIYFLDYLDGNLPDDQIDDFLDFLENNPDLHDELKAVSSIKLSGDELVFQHKESLLKNELTGVSPFDNRAVAYMEGDLPEEDEKLFVREITVDPAKEKQFDLLLKTKLQPDQTIIFPKKEQLYKKVATKVFMIWAGRAAAVVILLIGIWSVWNLKFGDQTPSPKIEQQLAESTQKSLNNENASVIAPTKELTAIPEALDLKPLKNKKRLIPVHTDAQELIAISGSTVDREQAPPAIQSLAAKIENYSDLQTELLVAMDNYSITKQDKYLTVDEYLAQKVLHQKEGESLRMSGVLSAGLEAVSNVSNDRLDYETNQNGKVSEISLNTRLLAFSIPFRKR